MDQYMVWLLILLVVGVVISNLMVLKYTSKFKWPTKNDTVERDEKKPDKQDSSGIDNDKP